MTEGALETAERVVISHTGRRVDFGCGAGRDGRDDTKACLANRNHRLDPIHLCPGGYVLEIEIGAEAQRVECYFHRRF